MVLFYFYFLALGIGIYCGKYKAAIVNNFNKMSPDFAVTFIPSASNEGAEIIVYSEEPLNTTLKEAEPVVVGENPCLLGNSLTPIMNLFSCASRNHSIYTVLVMKELGEPCQLGSYHCDSEILKAIHITAVVFDRDGVVYKKYQKIHTNSYDDYIAGPNEPGLSFTTDFGVTFGVTICFDIVFDNPTYYLMNTKGVKNMLWPLIWQPASALIPFGAGMSWIFNNNLMMIDWESTVQGSAFFEDGNVLNMTSTEEDIMIIAELEKDGPPETTRRSATENDGEEIRHKKLREDYNNERRATVPDIRNVSVQGGMSYTYHVTFPDVVTCVFRYNVSDSLQKPALVKLYSFNSTYADDAVTTISCGFYMCNKSTACNAWPNKPTKKSNLPLDYFQMDVLYHEDIPEDILFTLPKFMTDWDMILEYNKFTFKEFENGDFSVETKPGIDPLEKVLTIDMMGVLNMAPFTPPNNQEAGSSGFMVPLYFVLSVLLLL